MCFDSGCSSVNYIVCMNLVHTRLQNKHIHIPCALNGDSPIKLNW